MKKQPNRNKIILASLAVFVAFLFIASAASSVPDEHSQTVVRNQTTSNAQFAPTIALEEQSVWSLLESSAKEHGAHIGLSQIAFENEILNGFSNLSADSEFLTVLQESEVNGGTVSLGAVYNSSSSALNTFIIIDWNNGGYSFSEQYNLNMRTNFLDLNPVASARPVQYSGNALNAPSSSSSYSSTNWAGYGMYLKGGFFNLFKQTITANSANTQVVGMEMPPSNQVDNSVAQVATAWIGVSNFWNGDSGLAQTGYCRDVSADSGYSLFYEDYNSGVSNPQPTQCYPSSPTVSPGNILDMTVQASGSNWDFEIYNYNTSMTYIATVSSSTDTPSFSGYNALYILEAYSIGGAVQQIAKLSSPVNFEGQTFYSDNSVRYATVMYNNGWYNQFTMEQNGNTVNVQSSYVMQQGSYQTNLFGYSHDEWQSSVY